MPMSDENNMSDNAEPILFGSYTHNDTSADRQTAMNASLINLCNLESDLAATRLIVEENELDIQKLKKVNCTLRSELETLKKTDANQKAKLKTLMRDNDNLKRELSKFNGIRRYTVSNVNSSKPDNQSQMDNLRDELSITQAKLASLQDSVRTYAASLIDLTDSNAQSNNTVNLDFQVVTRRGRRSHEDVGERRNGHGEGQSSPEVETARPVTSPAPVAPPGGQTSEQRNQRSSEMQRSQRGPERKSYVGALRERLPDTVVIGTSLVKGVGARLHQRGIDNIVYSFPGAHLPLIRDRLDTILVPGKIPKNIVIQAAGNDVGHNRTDLVVKEYDKLIKDLRSRCPYSKIWLCKVPRRLQLSWLYSEIAKINTFLEHSNHGKNVKFIDSCPEFGPRYFKKDMVHFNNKGVQVYGDKIACSVINFHVNQMNRYH